MPAQRMLALLMLLVPVVASTGCRVFDINLIGLEKPIRTALVTDRVEELLNPQLSYNPLLLEMRKMLGRPVGLEPAFTHQAEPLLIEGHFQMAVATPMQFAQFSTIDQADAMVMPSPLIGKASRPAVLVVKADSTVEQALDLRGKRIGFGPKNNARTYFAALALLDESGIAPAEIKRGLLLEDSLWRHQLAARGRAESLLNGYIDAAFIDEAAWDKFPEKDERATEPCQSKLKVIARTVAVPDRIWLASPTLDAGTRERITNFLLKAREDHPDPLKWLNIGGYEMVDEQTLANCRKLTRIEPTLLNPATSTTANVE